MNSKEPFEKWMAITEYLLDKGYTEAWFKWLEWVTITSFFLALGVQVKSILLILISLASIVLLFFTGLEGTKRFLVSQSTEFENKFSKRLFIILFLVVTISVPWALYSILFTLLEGLVNGSLT